MIDEDACDWTNHWPSDTQGVILALRCHGRMLLVDGQARIVAANSGEGRLVSGERIDGNRWVRPLRWA